MITITIVSSALLWLFTAVMVLDPIWRKRKRLRFLILFSAGILMIRSFLQAAHLIPTVGPINSGLETFNLVMALSSLIGLVLFRNIQLKHNSAGPFRTTATFAVILGFAAVILLASVGWKTFSQARDSMYQDILEQQLVLARIIARESNNHQAGKEQEQLQALWETWQETVSQYGGSYVCKVDANGKLIAHLKREDQIGRDVMDMKLGKGLFPGPETLGELQKTGREWAGFFTAEDGSTQLVSFAFNDKNQLFAIHVPAARVENRIQALLKPLVRTIILACLLVPLALGLLILAWSKSLHQQKQARERMDGLIESSVRVAGEAFFEELVRDMASYFSARYALIARLDSTGQHLKPLAFLAEGRILDEPAIPLSGSVAEYVMAQNGLTFLENPQEQFPVDPLLKRLNIKFVYGIALPTEPGETAGLLMILNNSSLPLDDYAAQLMRFFSARASTELQRYRAQHRLSRSQERFVAIASAIPDHVCIFDQNGTYLDILSSRPDLLTRPIQEIIGNTIADNLPPTISNDCMVAIRETIHTGVSQRLEYKLNVLAGTRFFEGRTSLLENTEDGKPLVLWVTRNITARKEAEIAIRKMARRNAVLVQSLAQIVFDFQVGAKKIILEGSVHQILGFTIGPEGWDQDFWWERIHPKDLPPLKRVFTGVIHADMVLDLEYRFRCFNGTYCWLHLRGVPELNPEGLLERVSGVMLDINQRKRVEAELAARTEELHRRVKELDCLFGISKLMATPGLSLDQFLQGTASLLPASWRHPDLACAAINVAGTSYKTENFKETPWKLEAPLLVGGINKGTVQVGYLENPSPENQPFKAEEQALISLISREIGTILERHRSEEQIRQLSRAVDQSPSIVMITNPEGNLQYVNSRFSQLTGYGDEEVLGQNPRFLKSNKTPDEIYTSLWQALKTGLDWQGEFCNRKKDGTLFWAQGTISPVRNPSGQIINYLGVLEDITQTRAMEQENLQLEAQLRQAQKLETLGTLAGGIAHDFNNILSPILGYSEMGRMRVEDDSRLADYFDHILVAAGRARDLVQQILTFSRQREESFAPINLQLVVKEALNMLRSWIPSNIEILQYVDRDCPPIHGDPTRLQQVIMNLTTNAYQAMRDRGGQIEIRLESLFLDPQDTPAEQSGGHKVCLTVRDTGSGIDPSIIHRIFEPFFTTKEVGEGTGLGLSMVHGIVKAHGGHVTVKSHPGTGSVFRIYFDPVPRREKKNEKALEELLGGNERILLVDDEMAVAMMIRELLEKLGFQVEAFTSADAALEALSANTVPFDLVITDQSMPRMTGIQLAQTIQTLRPGLPIILATGYGDLFSQEELKRNGIAAGLGKPISISDLNRTIRNVLEHNSTPI